MHKKGAVLHGVHCVGAGGPLATRAPSRLMELIRRNTLVMIVTSLDNIFTCMCRCRFVCSSYQILLLIIMPNPLVLVNIFALVYAAANAKYSCDLQSCQILLFWSIFLHVLCCCLFVRCSCQMLLF